MRRKDATYYFQSFSRKRLNQNSAINLGENQPRKTVGTERETFPLSVTYELFLLLVCLLTKCAAPVLVGSLYETKWNK